MCKRRETRKTNSIKKTRFSLLRLALFLRSRSFLVQLLTRKKMVDARINLGYQTLVNLIFKRSFFLGSSDIDECTEPGHGCSQLCNNTLGGYNCFCLKGFWLEKDNKTCVGKLSKFRTAFQFFIIKTAFTATESEWSS